MRMPRLIRFGVEYRSESSYRLLMRLSGMSLRLPDPFVGRRDEKAIARRMAEIRDQVNDLLQEGWEAWRRRRGPRGARGRDEAHVAPQGEREQSCT